MTAAEIFSELSDLSVSISIGASGGDRRRVVDFEQTLLSGNVKEIDVLLETVDWISLLQEHTLDTIPEAISSVILNAWETYGIFKHVGNGSLPWFTPKVKFHRREARFWHRHAKKVLNPLAWLYVDGRFLQGEDVVAFRDYHTEIWQSELSKLREASQRRINKLIEADLHGTVRKLYRESGGQQVPQLRSTDSEGEAVTTRTDIEKANVLNSQFQRNSCLPPDFPTNADVLEPHITSLNRSLVSTQVDTRGNLSFTRDFSQDH